MTRDRPQVEAKNRPEVEAKSDRDDVERLCLEASGLDPGERTAFLDRAVSQLRSSNQAAVRAELDRLFAADAANVGFLDRPPNFLTANLLDAKAAKLGALAGYQILGVVGEGGMGTVYRAEQQHPRRIVALKAIKPAIAGEQALRRFETESDALGRLQHPGIAQIYDAGTTDDGSGPQPYFAMEFIEGMDLRAYAKASRAGASAASTAGATRLRPNIRLLLELMASVCDAVQHAHLRGIVHRDLKPGNILVDGSGQPKILDFGVARMIEPEGSPGDLRIFYAPGAFANGQTGMGQLIGTLAYMSPEQASGDPAKVDLRSDIYSLGVILYELLAGKLPYETDRRALHEAVRAIQEEEPAPLGSIDRGYRGDIEILVAKAIDKDKERRYSSAGELRDDIRRYLRDEPLMARPPSAAYQLRKFTRRHKAVVAGAAAVMLVLAAGAAATAWQAIRATAAERMERVSERAALDRQATATASEKRAELGARQAVAARSEAERERAAALREKLRADSEAASATAVTSFLEDDLLAQADAGAQAGTPDPDLKIRTALDRAAAGITGKFGGQPDLEASLRETIGWSYRGLGIYKDARAQLDRAVELRLRDLGPRDPKTLKAQSRQGQVMLDQGLTSQAEAILASTLRLQRGLPGAGQKDAMETMGSLALVYYSQAKYPQAEALRLERAELSRKTLGAGHPETLGAMVSLAASYRQRGAFAEAETVLSRVLEIRLRTLGPDHPDTLDCMYTLATVFIAWGKPEQAHGLAARALPGLRRVWGPSHPLTLDAMETLATSDMRTGRFADAEPVFVETLELRRRVQGPTHQKTLIAMQELAFDYTAEGKYAEAETLHRQTLELRRANLGPRHPQTTRSMYDLADVYRLQAMYREADALFGEALQARVATRGQEDPVTLDIMNGMANSWRAQGRYAEAEAMLGKALEILRSSNERMPNVVGKPQADLSLTYLERGKFGEGERLAREAMDLGEKRDPGGWRRLAAESLLGACLSGQKEYPEAEAHLLAAYRKLAAERERIPAPDRGIVDRTLDWIVRMYEGSGKPDEAARWRSSGLPHD